MHACSKGSYFVFYCTVPYKVKKKYLLVNNATNYPTARFIIMAPCFITLSNLPEHMMLALLLHPFYKKKSEKKNSLSIYFFPTQHSLELNHGFL